MSTTEYHIRIRNKEGNDLDILYPQSTPQDVIIDYSNYTSVPSTVENLDDLLAQLGDLAFEDSVAMNVGTGSEYGLVRTSNATSSSGLVLESGETAEDFVPTCKALFDVADSKVSTSGNETISGVKTFSDGIVIGNIRISYNENTHTLVYEEITS